MYKPFCYLTLAICASALPAQTTYAPVNAPYAQDLAMAAMKAHPELQKLGLHAVPPGQQDYVIVAGNYPSKIGKKSSNADLEVLQSGKPTVQKNDRGKFFDLCLPLSDAAARPVGLMVAEIPYAFAADAEDALSKATAIRDELQTKIPNRDRLFQQTSAPMALLQTIPLPTVKGRFDHFGVDLKHNRLFATAEDEHAVLVFDLVSARLINEIREVQKPHAILYREDLNRIYVTDGEAGALKIFDGATYKLLETVQMENDADAIGYEPSRRYLYIVSGGKDAGQTYSHLTVVDTTAARKVADIRIDGDTLEAMALDIWRPRLYVNNRAKNQVAVVDRFQQKVIADWPVTMGQDNVAMALDEAHQRLFVGCRSGHVVVFDSNTGKELQALPIAKGIDDLTYDAASNRLYAVGGGTVNVYEELDADRFQPLGEIAAGARSKTASLVPPVNRYFVAVPQTAAGAAAVQIFQPLNVPAGRSLAPAEAEPVRAPWALRLALATLSAHPDLRKMGLHAVPPGGSDSIIIANANTTRIGIKSSKGDLAAVRDGKTYCVRKDNGSFYNLKLPLEDASGRRIGILVMEIPFTSVPGESQAIAKAENIRKELARQIPDYNQLFQ